MPTSKRDTIDEEDAEDLAAFRDRAGEPLLKFEAVVRDLKKRGKL